MLTLLVEQALEPEEVHHLRQAQEETQLLQEVEEVVVEQWVVPVEMVRQDL
jgi:hypothetical protein